jgi:transglutaminase-like putative cysteine protease
MLLQIRHRTIYLYTRPVDLGPHRLMLRPRETPELRLLSFAVATTPPSLFSWSQDVYGNSVARALPLWSADSLMIDCDIRVDNQAFAAPILSITANAADYPFRYEDGEWNNLGHLALPQYADPQGRLQAWIQGFIAARPTGTLALLRDLNIGIADAIAYQSRQDHGTQTPLETLQRGWGSCRDFAVLMAEAARWLGFGARLVSGYIYLPDLDPGMTMPAPPHESGKSEAAGPAPGATHAWVDIYLPGAGWVAFDPTHRSYGGANLIPVAVARGIAELPPVEGSFTGASGDYVGMHVGVTVSAAIAQRGVIRGQ